MRTMTLLFSLKYIMLLFEKDVGKVLRDYDVFFSYCFRIEYDSTFKKNKIVLNVTRKDQFVVNDINLKTLGTFIKEVWSLKYFKRIEFEEVFETDFMPLNVGWSYKLMRYLKAKESVYCEKRNMIVRGLK